MEPEAVGAAIRSLNRDSLTAFVAALWTARGWAVEREGNLLRVRDGDEEHVLAPVPASRLPRAASVPDGADVVVAANPDAFDGTDRRVVGPADLTAMLRYGVAGGTADRLCREHLGAPLDELALPANVRARRSLASLSLRRIGASVALVAAVAALALTLPLNELFAPGSAPAEPEAGPPANVTPHPDGNRSYTAAGLVAAHRDALNGSAYRLTVTRIRSPPGPGEARIRTRTLSVDGERVRVNEGGVGLPGTVSSREVYLDGSVAFEATYRNRSFHYRRLSDAPGPVAGSFASLERHLSTETLGSRGIIARDGGRRTLVVGRGAPGGTNGTDYTVEILLGRDGFLHRVTAEYVRPTGGTVSVTWEFRTVDPTVVDAPLWYDREFRVLRRRIE